LNVNHLQLVRGRFLSDGDLSTIANVVVIGHHVAEQLFPVEDPLGKPLLIDSVPYSIVGVTADRTPSAGIGGSLSSQDFNDDLYIPISTLRARIGDEVRTPKRGGMDSEHVELS